MNLLTQITAPTVPQSGAHLMPDQTENFGAGLFRIAQEAIGSIRPDLKEAAAIFGGQAEELFETWDIPGRYLVYGDPGDLDGIKKLELLDYGEDDPDEDTEDAGDEEGISFFEVMEGLIAKSKAVTADMEAVLAELDSAFEPFRHNENHE